MSLSTRATSALKLAPTLEDLTALLARTLVRYGGADAAYDGSGRYDLIIGAWVPEGTQTLREEFLAAPRTQDDLDRRRLWLKGEDVAIEGDDFHEAAELTCDILCALASLGADHTTIFNRVQDDFLQCMPE